VGDIEQVIIVVGQWLAAGRRAAIATIVAREGSAPRQVGAKMAVSDTGETVGSIGGGGLDLEMIRRAKHAIESGLASTEEIDLRGASTKIDAFCGGRVSVFIEPLGESRRLFVFGAGHVGKALAGAARAAGFAVTVVDDRQELLTGEALGDGVAGIAASPAEISRLGIDPAAFVVICTRGHSLDKDWLRAVSAVAPRYVGMLGSAEKARKIAGELEKEGVAKDFLAAVRSPVGLAIGAETPDEIAVSITADLIAEWRGAAPCSR
jgi:xanthine dehydrogenase accessory factor